MCVGRGGVGGGGLQHVLLISTGLKPVHINGDITGDKQLTALLINKYY